MRTLRYIIEKEFLQLFRDKAVLVMSIGIPILQLLVLIHAADFSIENIRMSVVDLSRTSDSRTLISHFTSTNYFTLQSVANNSAEGIAELDAARTDFVLTIPADFANDISDSGSANILLSINGIDGQTAGMVSKYASAIIEEYNREITTQFNGISTTPPINIESRYWYNSTLNYKHYMLPGLLVILVSMIGIFLSAMNIVKEKERGTIEQINVSPIKKYQFIIGKLFPFWCLGMVELAFGLFIGYMLYDIPIDGDLTIIAAFASIFMLAVLGIGLFMSTIADTQQQAMFVSFFVVIIFILLSGMFTPIENMPSWAEKITYVNPIRWFIEVNRAVLLKGSGWQHLTTPFIAIITIAITTNAVAIFNYKKRS